MAKTKPIIVTKGLNVTYFPGQTNEVHALTDVNIDIDAGEFIIFFGPSGCGKSTLLYAISGLERRAQGKIIVNGNDLITMAERDREVFHQKTIGMIFQAYYLIPSLSVMQNVMLPRMAVGGSARERAAQAQKILDHFGVGTQARKLPDELSGGQRQRVAICRSVMNEPDILLADEPVGNLDTKSSQDVLDLLLDLNDKHKKTILLVTHNPAHLHYAHRIFYIRDGRIISVKRNTEAERRKSVIENAEEKGLPSGLKHWMLTFPLRKDLSKEMEAMLVRAQAMLAEKLTGLTVRDIGAVEKKVSSGILNGSLHSAQLRDFFHKEIGGGGLGLDRLRSAHLAKDVTRIVREVMRLHQLQKRADKAHRDPVLAQAREMRRFICKRMKLAIRGRRVFRLIDAAIADRICNTIDRATLQQHLSIPRRKGGAGMKRRLARVFARHLEPLVLGDFRKEKPVSKQQTPPEEAERERIGRRPTRLSKLDGAKVKPGNFHALKRRNGARMPLTTSRKRQARARQMPAAARLRPTMSFLKRWVNPFF